MSGNPDNDQEMQRILMQSIQQTNINQTLDEYIPIRDQVRKDGVPSGLRNLGNTCYFNSLIQTFFNIPEFVEMIMKFDCEGEENKDQSQNNQNEVKKFEFIKEIQTLFAYLIKSNKAYQDGDKVFSSFVDLNPDKVKKGEQSDVNEFLLLFINSLHDCLERKQKASDEEEKKSKEDKKEVEKDIEMRKEESALDGGQEDEKMEDENNKEAGEPEQRESSEIFSI